MVVIMSIFLITKIVLVFVSIFKKLLIHCNISKNGMVNCETLLPFIGTMICGNFFLVLAWECWMCVYAYIIY